MKVTKNRFLGGFAIVVILLSLARCIFPSIAEDKNKAILSQAEKRKNTSNQNKDTAKVADVLTVSKNVSDVRKSDSQYVGNLCSKFFNADGSLVKNRIISVRSFQQAFPDQNDVQLIAAEKSGVKPLTDRKEAENRKAELVYVGSNPYFYVDRLRQSIPYLVPNAAILLQDIGRNFFDSLQTKAVPLHKIIVTSVMRSKEDVDKLRGHNGNATQNSCHMYGTTFDVAYNRYKTVEDPEGVKRRQVRNDTLKWILSEVLNDLRLKNRCFVKYEVHQGCFHITTK